MKDYLIKNEEEKGREAQSKIKKNNARKRERKIQKRQSILNEKLMFYLKRNQNRGINLINQGIKKEKNLSIFIKGNRFT